MRIYFKMKIWLDEHCLCNTMRHSGNDRYRYMDNHKHDYNCIEIFHLCYRFCHMHVISRNED